MKRLISVVILISSVKCFGAAGGLSGSPLSQGFGNTIGLNLTTISISSGDPSLIIGTNPPVGASYIISPGIYYCSNWMKCPTNGSIVGTSAGNTILVDMFTNGIPTPLIACSDNGYIADLTITNFYFDTAAGVPASCIGTHFNLAQVSGNAVVAGQGGYSNFIGERLILYGGSDTWYNRHTNNCDGELRYCKLYGPWDIVTAFNTGNHRYRFKFCDFNHTAVASHGNNKDIFVASFTANAKFSSWFCNFFMTNGIQPDDYFFNGGDSPTTQLADYHYCNFTNASGGRGAFVMIGGGASSVKFENCNLRASSFGDDISSMTGLFYGTNLANSVVFAGDQANGDRVSLSVPDNASDALTLNSSALLRVTPLQTLQGNRAAPSSISVTASPFSWTNTQTYNQTVFIIGGTASAIAINGTTIYTVAGDVNFILQTNEWTTVTYTVAPTMKSKPF